MEAISHAGAAVGILGKDGVVLACEKKIASKLLEPGTRLHTRQQALPRACSRQARSLGWRASLTLPFYFLFLIIILLSRVSFQKGKRSEKMYRIDDHIACAVAGITADANILLNFSRLAAQRYAYSSRLVPDRYGLLSLSLFREYGRD
jgi:20S proteasome subunit alpha 3